MRGRGGSLGNDDTRVDEGGQLPSEPVASTNTDFPAASGSTSNATGSTTANDADAIWELIMAKHRQDPSKLGASYNPDSPTFAIAKKAERAAKKSAKAADGVEKGRKKKTKAKGEDAGKEKGKSRLRETWGPEDVVGDGEALMQDTADLSTSAPAEEDQPQAEPSTASETSATTGSNPSKAQNTSSFDIAPSIVSSTALTDDTTLPPILSPIITSAPAPSSAKEKKKSKTSPSCPICNAPFHLRFKCPIVTAGPESIAARIAELRSSGMDDKNGREARNMLIADLEKDFESTSKKGENASSPTTLEKGPLETVDEEVATTPRRMDPRDTLPPLTKVFGGVPWTPTIPSGSQLSEVTVQSPGEGSSDEEEEDPSDSEDDVQPVRQSQGFARGLIPPPATTARRGTSLYGDVDLDALLRGPSVPVSKKVLSMLSSEEGERDDSDSPMEVEEEEVEESKSRKNRRQQRARTPSASEEDDDTEGAEATDPQPNEGQDGSLRPVEETRSSQARSSRASTVSAIEPEATPSFKVLDLRGESAPVEPRGDNAFREVLKRDDLSNLAESLTGTTANEDDGQGSVFDFTQSTAKDPELSTSTAEHNVGSQDDIIADDRASSVNHEPASESQISLEDATAAADPIETASEPSQKEAHTVDSIEVDVDPPLGIHPSSPLNVSQIASPTAKRLLASPSAPSKLHSPGRTKQMRDRHGKTTPIPDSQLDFDGIVEPPLPPPSPTPSPTPHPSEQPPARGTPARGRGRARGRGAIVAARLATPRHDEADEARPRTRSQARRNTTASPPPPPVQRRRRGETIRIIEETDAVSAPANRGDENGAVEVDEQITAKPVHRRNPVSQSSLFYTPLPLDTPRSPITAIPPSMTQWTTLPVGMSSDTSRSSPAGDDELVSSSPHERDGAEIPPPPRLRMLSVAQKTDTSGDTSLDDAKVEALTPSRLLTGGQQAESSRASSVDENATLADDPKPPPLIQRWLPSIFGGRRSNSLSQEPPNTARSSNLATNSKAEVDRSPSSASSTDDSDDDALKVVPRLNSSQPPAQPFRRLSELTGPSQRARFSPRFAPSSVVSTPTTGFAKKNDLSQIYGMEDDDDDDDDTGSGSDSDDEAKAHIPKDRRAGVTPSMRKRKT